MGPRLGSRGKFCPVAVMPLLWLLQWGRDLEVAERAWEWCDGVVRLLRFNGAATWKSRKVACINPSENRFPLLQWGRDLEVAERRYQRIGPFLLDLSLQWGRDLEVAERRPDLQSESLGMWLLQWGRDLEVAERGP